MNKIITISREFGSGGRTIGRETAKKLNIPCYDQELIEKVQKESGFTKEYIDKNGENASTSILNRGALRYSRAVRRLCIARKSGAFKSFYPRKL